MEIWDGYTADRMLAGVDMVRERESEYPKWLYHIVSDVVVRHADGTYLAMQRDFNKIGHPGEWELGAGGSVVKGETPIDGAIRELYEETGIKAGTLILADIVTKEYENGCNTHYYVFFCETAMNKSEITLQKGETIAFKWVTADEIRKGDFICDRKYNIIIEEN